MLNHPAVTAAIIGPRTMEQLESQLAGADVTLDEPMMDRIDEIVTPGTNINPADNSQQPGSSPYGTAALARRPRFTTKEHPMASRLNPYISFPGTAREALEFYDRVFGGT